MKRRLLPWAVAASFLLHGVAYAVAPRGAPAQQVRAPQNAAAFRCRRARKAAADPAAVTAEPPKPKPRALEPKPEPKLQAAPTPPQAPPPVSEGVTLAADGSSNAFGMPLGNGGALDPTRRAPPPGQRAAAGQAGSVARRERAALVAVAIFRRARRRPRSETRSSATTRPTRVDVV